MSTAIVGKKITLMGLYLENFKGVRDFSLALNGASTVVRGDNGTGKTTLADGFMWLLFDKDSRGKSDFQIKTLDKDNEPLHNLEHSVSVSFDVSGDLLELRKVYKEVYTKKRGSSHSEHTGHTTDYFVNDVPTPKREYETKIGVLVGEDTFRLLTSPTHFPSLHWKKQREILLSVCGDILDEDVIASDSELKNLTEILGKHTLDDHRKVVNARKATINDRLKELPARIDECNKSLVDVEHDPNYLRKKIETIETDIALLKADDGKSAIVKKIHDLNNDLMGFTIVRDNEQKSERDKESLAKEGLNASLREVEQGKATCISKVSSLKEGIVEIERNIERKEAKMTDLRTEYEEVEAKQANAKTHCPSCNQGLPENEVERATELFNSGKAEQLRRIDEEGKKLKSEVGTRRDEIALDKVTIEDIGREFDKHEEESGNLTRQIDAIPPAKIIQDTEEMVKLQSEIEALQDKRDNLTPADTSELETKLEDFRSQLTQIDTNEKTQVRITDLADEEKMLAKEYGEKESETFLMEKFVVAKVSLLESNINSLFKMARFKLFHKQQNGGINEVCEATYLGVPYGSGLNNGARIAVGMDIVSVLQKHYGISATIWIDNAESITRYPAMQCQVVKLVVDENYKELNVSLDS